MSIKSLNFWSSVRLGRRLFSGAENGEWGLPLPSGKPTVCYMWFRWLIEKTQIYSDDPWGWDTKYMCHLSSGYVKIAIENCHL